MQLGQGIALGSALLSLPVLPVLLIPSCRSASQSWHRIGTWLLAFSFVSGLAILLTAGQNLAVRVKTDKWNLSDVESLRNVSDRGWLLAVTSIPIVVWLIDLILSGHGLDDLSSSR